MFAGKPGDKRSGGDTNHNSDNESDGSESDNSNNESDSEADNDAIDEELRQMNARRKAASQQLKQNAEEDGPTESRKVMNRLRCTV